MSGGGDRLSDADGGGLSGDGRNVLGDAGSGGGVGKGSSFRYTFRVCQLLLQCTPPRRAGYKKL